MKNQEIKRGEFNMYYQIEKLNPSEMNRDLIDRHAENFTHKLNEFGWMAPIIIAKNGDIIEGHHRFRSAELLKQKTVPVYIIDWVDTTNKKEVLKFIISLNNGNKGWSKLDFLKCFIDYNDDYKKVYNAYKANSNNVSVGNVINCFFGKSNGADFKNGESKIINEELSMFLLSNFSRLYESCDTNRITAYCVRELISVSFIKARMDMGAIKFLLIKYEEMAIKNHPAVTSITEFKPVMEMYLSEYNLKNASNR